MMNIKNTSRLIGICLLLQIAGGIVFNFVLMGPVFQAPGFLLNAASYPSNFGISVLLSIATSLLSIVVAVLIWPFFRRHSVALAIGYVALVAVNFAVHMLENISLMSVLSLSEAYVKASLTERANLEALSVLVTATRNWSHYINLIIAGCTLFLFYSTLYRSALVPRILAGLGMLAVLSQLVAVSMPLFGKAVMFGLLAPLGLCQLALALYLIFIGLKVEAQSAAT